MNCLFVGNNPRVFKRIESICKNTGISPAAVQSGYDALTQLQLQNYQLVIIYDQLELISAPDTIKRLRSQKKQFLVMVYLTDYSVAHLYQFLEVGCDRWILDNAADDEIKDLLMHTGLDHQDFLQIDRHRFQLTGQFHINNLIGSSPVITDLYRTIEKTVNSNISVLVRGESGSGKELVARLIHAISPRAKQKFVGLNCAAVPNDLMESELFGFEKGAFTGANMQKKGKFEYAHGGTLFLDEIADMGTLMQSKILRVIEQKEFERIGSNQTIQADVRIVSASNKSLEELISHKEFRMDLYYRINSFSITIPPLRNRPEDILPLTVYFVHQLNRINHRNIQRIEEEAIQLLQQHPWYGNIRELENLLSRCVLYTDTNTLTTDTVNNILERIEFTPEKPREDMVAEIKHLSPGISSAEEIIPLEELEKNAIINALTVTQGNVSESARKLGVSRVTVWRKIEKYNLKQYQQDLGVS